MSMGKRKPTPALDIHLLREGIIESRHHAEVAVCDERGRVLATAGNLETSYFVRSALKPFQALAVTTTGTLEQFELSDRDLAIMCGSHRGHLEQVRQVFNILWRCDVEPSALRCPTPVGKDSPLEHTCSGKHAGMLAVCQQRNWPLQTYPQRRHPLQHLILEKLADLLKMPADEFIAARDDCGVPTYCLELSQMATLYAKLAAGENLALERMVRAMVHHPTLVSGTGNFDTDLMELAAGDVVSKSGAEGIQCIGRIGEGMGLAIKVADGAKRAKCAVAIHILKELGWITPTVADTLAERYLTLSDCQRLEVLGELSMT
ncbi:MAG: asparaginase [Thermosynechococcaceae cyanobacterium]